MKIKAFALLLLLCGTPALTVANQKPASQPAPPAAAAPAGTPAKTAASASKGPSAIDPAKEAAIRKLFDVGGTKESVKQLMVSMTDTMKPMLESSLPPGEYRAQLIELFFQRFMSKFGPEQLLELAIPIYDKHFSLEEIDGLTKFYQTPLGKKAISVLPQIVLETQAAGRQMGEQIGREAMLEVLDEHPDLKKALEEASATKNPR